MTLRMISRSRIQYRRITVASMAASACIVTTALYGVVTSNLKLCIRDLQARPHISALTMRSYVLQHCCVVDLTGALGVAW